jgi:hypothetical protein
VGACVFTDSESHPEWSEQEADDLNVIANLFASKLMQIESQKALDEARSRLHVATTRLDEEDIYLSGESQTSAVH